ncbi:MAG: carboxylesterase family protein [Rhodospirillales bacterium]
MRGIGLGIAVALVAGPASARMVTTVGVPTPVVQTTGGPIQGYQLGGINFFLGVPYAAPPVGSLRWVAPTPPSFQGATRQTVAFGNFCPQGLSQLSPGGGSEDCLYLNVEGPASATQGSKLPVMVWIHGGGLTTGSGQEYNGTSLIQGGNVIFVSLNYRLGLLGFMGHPALAAEDTVHHSSGNYGMLDQQAALAWVRANIANFGGDPNNLTIFGESAGGQSVITQLYSPLTGKLKAAIIESGAYARTYPTQAEAQSQGTSLATTFGCTDQTAACLRTIPAAALVVAGGSDDTGSSSVIAPNVDGWMLTQQPFQAFAAGNFQHIPIIDGSNHDEYRLFVSENDLLNAIGGHPGGYTAADYIALVQGLAGSFAPQVLAEYPLSKYPSPNYAVAAVGTDYAFSCGALLLDALMSQYTSVYAYEFNDINPPNIFLPPDPFMTSIGDSHAIELPYLFPTYRNVTLNLGPAAFTLPQQYLGGGMRAAWTSLARYGRPLNPRGGAWGKYSVAAHAFASFVAPSNGTETGFYTDHKCNFWGPALLSEAGLPPETQY